MNHKTLLEQIRGGRSADSLTDAELELAIEQLNDAYRSGASVVSDTRYDNEFMVVLADRLPGHRLLLRVEPEPEEVFGSRKIRHAQPLLSAEKAYTCNEVERFLKRVLDAARETGVDPQDLMLRATVKLDGLAGSYDGSILATRGDGISGFDITRCLGRGVRIMGAGHGNGELVVSMAYFEDNLSEQFEHPRNFMVGAISADDLTPIAAEALSAGAAHFVLYGSLPSWTGTPDAFLADMDNIVQRLKAESADYANDGLILETLNPVLRAHLGATSHHYRSMIALKERGETAITTVDVITWQTGRTGRVTPVMNVAPVHLSGATIANVTAHHAGLVRDLGIGPGATIEIIRSGEVIPKVERVLTVATVTIPTSCPSCAATLIWEGDKFLTCPNTGCKAQVENSLRHFFTTLGTADLFGPATIAKLNEAGVCTLDAIYRMTEADFRAAGFGPGQSPNLVRELARSRTEPVDAWRFLAAFGVRHLGRGDSRHLLQAMRLHSLRDIRPETIRAIPGFGEVTSASISAELAARWPSIQSLLDIGFNLVETAGGANSDNSSSAVAGKRIVFTGTMASGDRENLEEAAARLGAQVQSAVNGKTDYLVVGEKPGASKLTKARTLGTRIITEAEYLSLV